MNDFAHVSENLQKLESIDLKEKYLTFWIEKQVFGISMSDVVKVIKMQEITEIHGLPNYCRGIINLRGSVIPLIDLRLRFNKQEKEYGECNSIIVTNIMVS